MIFFLLFFILLITIFIYYYSYKYILHPAVMVGFIFSLSVFVAVVNYSNWGDISVLTFTVILCGLFFFWLGCAIGDKFRIIIGKREEYPIINVDVLSISISKTKTVIVVAVMIIVTILDFWDIQSIAGNAEGILSITTSARIATYKGEAIVSHGIFLQQALYACRALTYVYIYYVFYKLVITKQRVKLLELLPILLYFVQALLSTGRTEFIYIFYTILFLNYVFIQNNKSWKPIQDFRFLKKIIIVVIVFFVIFITISNSRKGGSVNIFDTISNYTGSSIPALNIYINENGISSCASFWGEETQSLVYSILRAVGLSAKSTTVFMPPVYIGTNSTMTNIYTAFRRWIHDYGFFGMLFISMMLGWLYSAGFRKIKDERLLDWKLIVFAFISYPLVELSIEERFFSNLITARTVYCVLYIYVLYKLLIRKKYSG